MREGQDCFSPNLENTDTVEATVRVELPNIKNVAKQKVAKVYWEKAKEDAAKIPFQGAMLSLLAQEKDDISWQVLKHKVPSGTMASAVRARTKTQATTDNLARWGVRVDIKCLIDSCRAPLQSWTPPKELPKVSRPLSFPA